MASANWMKATTQKAGAMRLHLGQHEREVRNHQNKHIDPARSERNMIFGCTDYDDAFKRMKARTKEVDKLIPPKRIRKDRVTCCFIEIPCPNEVRIVDGWARDERTTEFFEKTYAVLCSFFGAENVHGGFVHRDELHYYLDKDYKDHKDHLGDYQYRQSLEHMHVLVSAYTPEKGINGKAFETKARLKALNTALDDMCFKSFGVHLNTGDTPGKKTVEQLKHESEIRDIKVGLEQIKKSTEKAQEDYHFYKGMAICIEQKLQRQNKLFEENEKILNTKSAEMPQGTPVPAVARLLLPSEHKEKVLYDAKVIQDVWKRADAVAIGTAKEQSLNKTAEELDYRERCITLDREQVGAIYEDINKQKDALQSERTELERKAAMLNEREKVLGEMVLTHDMTLLKSRCDELLREVHQLQGQIDDLQGQIKYENYRLGKKEKEIANLTQDRDSLKDQVEHLTDELNTARSDLSKAIDEAEKKQKEERERAAKELKAEHGRSERYREQLNAAIEVGEYRDDDFKRKVKMCLEDYKLEYIYGENNGYER